MTKQMIEAAALNRTRALGLLLRVTSILEQYLNNPGNADRRTAGLVFKRGHVFAFRNSEKLIVGRPFSSESDRSGVVLFSDILGFERIDACSAIVSFRDSGHVVAETIWGDEAALATLEFQINSVSQIAKGYGFTPIAASPLR